MARYFIGIDGGGTGTRCRLADSAGRVLGEGRAGPSGLSLGVEPAWAAVDAAVAGALDAAGLGPSVLGEIALAAGLAGSGTPARRRAFLERPHPFAALTLVSDAYAAVLGAHGGRPGAVVVIGTGSGGHALRADGTTRRVGGWGFPAGDEGSGAWIGWRAVQRWLWRLDGRLPGPADALDRAVAEHCGADPAALLGWTVGASPTKYATVAPLAVAAAGAGVPAALALLGEAAEHVARHIDALDPEGALPLALAGGLAPFVAPHLPGGHAARLVEAQADAAAGALLLARGLAPAERPERPRLS
ncbi:MAG TPA: BadF/BadG/BcrA/BcrD ATPase family protein [Alphaproteobacteria bacterium]|nr:BadF/BadG/BcrA/BcrD ATPase family protein [Alphaproteobacteria bacterium]